MVATKTVTIAKHQVVLTSAQYVGHHRKTPCDVVHSLVLTGVQLSVLVFRFQTFPAGGTAHAHPGEREEVDQSGMLLMAM